MKCPRCRKVFLDFTGCFALSCPECGCGFCGWCLADCGKDAHAHVHQCSDGPANGNPYGTAEEFDGSNTRRRRRLIGDYLATLDDATRHSVLDAVDVDLRGVGLADLCEAGPAGEAPCCPTAGHTMVITDGRNFYVASQCKSCGNQSAGERWVCLQCQDDYCYTCKPRDGWVLPGKAMNDEIAKRFFTAEYAADVAARNSPTNPLRLRINAFFTTIGIVETRGMSVEDLLFAYSGREAQLRAHLRAEEARIAVRPDPNVALDPLPAGNQAVVIHLMPPRAELANAMAPDRLCACSSDIPSALWGAPCSSCVHTVPPTLTNSVRARSCFSLHSPLSHARAHVLSLSPLSPSQGGCCPGWLVMIPPALLYGDIIKGTDDPGGALRRRYQGHAMDGVIPHPPEGKTNSICFRFWLIHVLLFALQSVISAIVAAATGTFIDVLGAGLVFLLGPLGLLIAKSPPSGFRYFFGHDGYPKPNLLDR